MKPPVRILFLGTPEFALPSFRLLLDSPATKVVGVITQPDRPAGRGFKLVSSPVKILAEERALPIFQPKRLRDNEEALRFCRELNPDLAVVVAFGQILPREVFEIPPLGTLNVHASLLPGYRGAAPIEHAILRGESVTGVTIMKIEEGLDSGDILSMRSTPIGENTTGGELAAELAILGASLLLETIPEHVAGRIRAEPQNHTQASYAPRIEKDQARINWRLPARNVHNLIRAFNPRPGAFAHFRGEFAKIWSSRTVDEERNVSEGIDPGSVVEITREGVIVACGVGSVLSLRELQLAGRKRLSAWDFVNGVEVRVGEAFT